MALFFLGFTPISPRAIGSFTLTHINVYLFPLHQGAPQNPLWQYPTFRYSHHSTPLSWVSFLVTCRWQSTLHLCSCFWFIREHLSSWSCTIDADSFESFYSDEIDVKALLLRHLYYSQLKLIKPTSDQKWSVSAILQADIRIVKHMWYFRQSAVKSDSIIQYNSLTIIKAVWSINFCNILNYSCQLLIQKIQIESTHASNQRAYWASFVEVENSPIMEACGMWNEWMGTGIASTETSDN